MSTRLSEQATRLYYVFSELVRRYQFRDREGIVCHGLSVSQCYTLDALAGRGPSTMSELAAHLHLKISTMTRVVDHLVAGHLATRVADARDRRVCRVRITRAGRALLGRIHAELIKEHQGVLREIAPESREAVISAMSHLLSAFKDRQRRSAEVERRKRSRAG